MKNVLCLVAIVMGTSLSAQVKLNGDDVLIQFEDFMGDGICNNPISGALNSENWMVTGMSSGNIFFDDCAIELGDFARGYSVGGVGSGGIYAFQVNEDQIGLGVQATSSDFSPGAVILRLQNTSNMRIDGLKFSFDLWINNNENRSSYWNTSVGRDLDSLILIPTMCDTSNQGGDLNGFVLSSFEENLDDLKIEPNSYLFLKWESGDIAGTGSRDEFAIANIQVSMGKNLEESPNQSAYYSPGKWNNEIHIDISRLEGLVKYSIVDPNGEIELLDSVENESQILLDFPDSLDGHLLHINHKSKDRWIELHK